MLSTGTPSSQMTIACVRLTKTPQPTQTQIWFSWPTCGIICAVRKKEKREGEGKKEEEEDEETAAVDRELKIARY